MHASGGAWCEDRLLEQDHDWSLRVVSWHLIQCVCWQFVCRALKANISVSSLLKCNSKKLWGWVERIDMPDKLEWGGEEYGKVSSVVLGISCCRSVGVPCRRRTTTTTSVYKWLDIDMKLCVAIKRVICAAWAVYVLIGCKAFSKLFNQ